LVRFYFIRCCLVWLVLWSAAAALHAQEPFPGEPAHLPRHAQSLPPMNPYEHPALPSQQDPGVLRVTSNLVLVPTLVERKNGAIVYGLKSSDFSLYDDGIPQRVHLDSDMDLAPISLVVCVERGRDAPLVMEEIQQLGTLLQLFTGGGHTDTALVVFDSKPVYLDGFSSNPSYVEQDLENLAPGDGGAAIMDAVGFSLDLLEHQPANHRRVLLLISETRDHGSTHVTIPSLVQRIGESNTLVLSLVFSPARAELNQWGRGGSSRGTINLLAPLMMTYNAMRKNVPRTLARMTGGEYTHFGRDQRFQMDVVELANHTFNRYLLSFQPNDPKPGLHHLDVRLNDGINAEVLARTSYWAVSPSG